MAKSSAEKIEVIFPKLSFSWILLKTKAHSLWELQDVPSVIMGIYSSFK
jgi:hypothetical protein